MACENSKQPKKILNEEEASHYIAMSRPWLRIQRVRHSGPNYLKIGRSVRYSVSDLDSWLESKRVIH
jgi:predicted DNA-binding transcriptional regulator AlpA